MGRGVGRLPLSERSEGASKKIAAAQKLPPIHPGTLLREDLADIGVSLNELARATRMPLSRVSRIVNGERSITAETALRLARYFGTSSEYWLGLQMHYDLDVAQDACGAQVEKEVLARDAA